MTLMRESGRDDDNEDDDNGEMFPTLEEIVGAQAVLKALPTPIITWRRSVEFQLWISKLEGEIIRRNGGRKFVVQKLKLKSAPPAIHLSNPSFPVR